MSANYVTQDPLSATTVAGQTPSIYFTFFGHGEVQTHEKPWPDAYSCDSCEPPFYDANLDTPVPSAMMGAAHSSFDQGHDLDPRL